jgi:hypothetical protein
MVVLVEQVLASLRTLILLVQALALQILHCYQSRLRLVLELVLENRSPLARHRILAQVR